MATVEITVRMDKASDKTVSVTYSTRDGTANAGSDYVAQSGTLTFLPGQIEKKVTVDVPDRLAGDPAEFFYLDALSASNATVGDGTGQVSIPAGDAAAVGEYLNRFNTMYAAIHNPNSGYFGPPSGLSARTIPYHCPETLVNEAPDFGHESVSETMSFYIGLEVWQGHLNGNWSGYKSAWNAIEAHFIPSAGLQPIGVYNPGDPADYAPEQNTPNLYPVAQDSNAAVGADPLYDELLSTYGEKRVYLLHWMMDVDGIFGYYRGDGATQIVPINNYRRGLQESAFETVTHPCWEDWAYGHPTYGFLPLFSQGKPIYPAAEFVYNRQYFYTCAPDAEARIIQWAGWGAIFATEQSAQATISTETSKARRLGDYLRYSLFDKYFRKIGPDRAQGGTGYESCHYLINWYVSWGGEIVPAGENREGYWSFRIGSSESHQGYQAVDAAYFMATGGAGYTPLSPSAGDIWLGSLYRQIEAIRWLQSPEGPIAGGLSNSLFARYETPTDGREAATFYGMYYVYSPIWHDPPSNNWVGFQCWGQGRTASALLAVADKQTALAAAIRPNLEIILDKLVAWFLDEVTLTGDGSFSIPAVLSWVSETQVPGETTVAPNLEGVYEYLPSLAWDGTGDYGAFWDASTVPNPNLHCSVVEYGQDLGVAASLALMLVMYAEAKRRMGKFTTAINGGEHTPEDAYTLAKEIIDRIWTKHRDSIGIAVSEVRTDYQRMGDPVYVPAGFNGTMPNGDLINENSTFISLRSFLQDQPGWTQVANFIANPETAPEPTFTYHRFWAQCEYAMALGALHAFFGDIVYA